MATAERMSERRAVIAAAIAEELQRQADHGAVRIDVEALAEAVEAAMASPSPAMAGKRPEQLNATNDD